MPGLYSYLGMEDRALAEARAVAQRYPDNATALYTLGLAAAELSEFEEAITAHRRAAAINPRWKGALGRSYAVAGRAIVAELEAEPNPWNAYAVAEIYSARSATSTRRFVGWRSSRRTAGYPGAGLVRRSRRFGPMSASRT
jgi:tetratricopeptide (TPR) repeat protein